MRTTIDLPDSMFKRVKLQATRQGLTLKQWFIQCLSREVDEKAGIVPPDEAGRFRKRFDGTFEPSEIEEFKRSGRA